MFEAMQDALAATKRDELAAAGRREIAEKAASVAQGAATTEELVGLIFDRAAPGEVFRGGRPKRRLNGARR